MLNLRCRLRCAAVIIALVCAGELGDGARAGEGFPHKPVRILVPYGAGGAGDLTIRLLADKLSNNLKRPFIVESRPGAGGIVAMRAVLSSAADGYTLGEMGNGQAVSTSLLNLPYDPLYDFVQISVAARFVVLLAVPPKSPYKTVKDVVEAARRAPGKLNLGAINPGSTQNLSTHLFQQISGAQFTIVTYRTTPDLVTALLRGDVDLGFDYFAGLESMIGPDKLRIIATSGETRDPILKDVPTVKESGLPDMRSRGGTASALLAAFQPTSSPCSTPRSGGPWRLRTFRIGCCASGSRRGEERLRKCMSRWPRILPSGVWSSRRLEV